MDQLSLRERFHIVVYDEMPEQDIALIEVDESKCKECGICVTACGGACLLTGEFTRADYMKKRVKGKQGVPRLVRTANQKTPMCVGCLTCAAACPHGAISIVQGFMPGGRIRKLHQCPEYGPPKRY